MRQVVLVLHGGFGNQLFQLFYALLVVKADPSSVRIYTGKLSQYSTSRELELKAIEKQFAKPTRFECFIASLRFPKVITKLGFGEHNINLFQRYYLDGYFQEIKNYNKNPLSIIASFNYLKRSLVGDCRNIPLSTENNKVLHLRLTDFFRSSNTANEFIEKVLSEAVLHNKFYDVITDDDELVLNFIRSNNLLNVRLVTTRGDDAKQVMGKLMGYKTIVSNGSTLAFWAALFSGGNLCTSNEEQQRTFDYLKDLVHVSK